MAIRRIKTKTKGLRYAARVHLGDGKYELLEPRPTLKAAKQDEANWLTRRLNRERKTGDEWADFYLEGYAERVKDSTLHHAENGLRCWRRTFGPRTLSTITPIEAEEWARANNWALPPVVTMMNYAVRRELLDRNPFAGLTKRGPGRKHNKPLSVAEVDALAAAADKHHGKTLRAFILFAAYSGLRPGEMFALQWGDIDFGGNWVTVRQRLYRGSLGPPKSNKVRKVVLLPEAREAALTLDQSTEWVFVGKRGKRMSQGGMAYYWQKIEAEFGKPVQPHELRHFTAHHLYVTKGYRDFVVAEQLGHNDGGKLIRDLYGHGDHSALEEIARTYEQRTNVIPFRRAAGE